jgi:transcription elongation factor Elf1
MLKMHRTRVQVKKQPQVLLACQNCGHLFRKAGIDWRKTKKIAKIKCPACKQPFRGEENALHDLSA